jgi:Transglycosylase SLT domain
MAYSATAILALASQCAPSVAPETVLAIIQTESSGDPLALNVNGGRQPARQSGLATFSFRSLEIIYLTQGDGLCRSSIQKISS